MQAFSFLLMSSLWQCHSSYSQCPCSQPRMGLTSHTAPSLKPRWLWEDRRGLICFVSARYAFTATTRDILSPRIYVSWLKPAPHRERESERETVRAENLGPTFTLCFRGHAPGEKLSACKLHQASPVPRKDPNYTEDRLNIQRLLSVCLWVALCPSVPKERRQEPSLCPERPSFIELKQGSSRINTLMCKK